MTFDSVSHVVEVLVYDARLSEDDLAQLQEDVLRYTMVQAKYLAGRKNVGGVSVSAYIGDASLVTVGRSGYLPLGVKALHGISEENAEHEEV